MQKLLVIMFVLIGYVGFSQWTPNPIKYKWINGQAVSDSLVLDFINSNDTIVPIFYPNSSKLDTISIADFKSIRSGGTITTVITLDGSGTLARPEFEGLSLSEIKAKFLLFYDGSNLIGRNGTTLAEDGEINFNFSYSGTAYLVKLR